MGALIILEIILLVSSIFGGGVTVRLDQNAKDILHERVINRTNYLETEMVSNWSNISLTVQDINRTTQRLWDQGVISPQTLDDGSESCTPLILEISQQIISLMRSNRVTGAFVVFNNEDLNGSVENKPGIYLRDLDPASNPSVRNLDLLIERAPAAVVQQLGISTDSGWRPRFEFSKREEGYYPFLYQPYQNALENRNSDFTYLDYGYWSEPYNLFEDNKEAISYSVPLMLEDGTLYGVLGIELTTDYLKKLVPYSEVSDDKQGSYLLVRQDGDSEKYLNILVNGPVYQQSVGTDSATRIVTEGGDSFIDTKDESFYCSIKQLNLYNTNTPFSSQKWMLVGAVRQKDLFSFSNRITSTLLFSIFITLFVGIIGAFWVSRSVSKRIVTLAKSMDEMRPADAMHLERTGITEFDRLVSSIENLSREVIDSATKFSQIIEMASVKIAGFEIKREEKALFLTDRFFEILGMPEADGNNLTVDEFASLMNSLKPRLLPRESEEEEYVFRFPADKGTRYVKIKTLENKERCIGLIEDVTKARVEKDLIEHERDYDLLTSLINRRAFYRIMRRLFEQEPEKLKNAALVMMDLDNLKQLNDTYGHDCGDKYIKAAADCFQESTPANTIISRISGDEFYLFFYGYEKKDDIRRLLACLKTGIKEKTFSLPNLERRHIMVSGGVAWYPDDSTSFEELLKYSDYAMYKIKQSVKGEFGEFDLGIYNRESYLLQNKMDLIQLIEKRLVDFFFQPIVHAGTGEIFAYEALMRSKLPTLRSPLDVLALAKLESKLNQIEELVWYKALEFYANNVSQGKMNPHAKVFVNSIANQAVPPDKLETLETRFKPYLNNVVMEITEDEQLSDSIIQYKREMMNRWQASLALDDYGSGYNSEKNLLRISPQFIKVDISIIRDIDRDTDKQKIFENIISYAHERSMSVVAEGIETPAEMELVIRMGADFLQGYFLARPEFEPPIVSEEAKAIIAKLSGNR